jgi:hypothetical protein
VVTTVGPSSATGRPVPESLCCVPGCSQSATTTIRGQGFCLQDAARLDGALRRLGLWMSKGAGLGHYSGDLLPLLQPDGPNRGEALSGGMDRAAPDSDRAAEPVLGRLGGSGNPAADGHV